MKRLEWKVGLFVAIGLVLLAALLIAFSKGVTLFQPTYTIQLHAGNVGGLKNRASVLMAGVQVGTVSDIRLDPDGKSVTIVLRVYRHTVIYRDARFLIQQSGFLGDQFVAIQPTENKGDVFQDGQSAQAEPPFDLQEVARSANGLVQRVDETARKLDSAIVDVRRLLLNPQTLTNLAAASLNVRAASEQALQTASNINVLVAGNGPALNASVSNLVVFSAQMKDFGHSLNSIVQTNSPDLHEAVKNIESSTAVLNNLLEDVREGKGPAGTLLRNQQMAENMGQIAYNLSITTSNLNRLGLWGILWKQKVPHTNAPTAGRR